MPENKKNEDHDSLLEKLEKIEEQRKFESIKANKVPNFDDLHRKFERDLEKRRNKFKPTKIKEFKLTSPSKSIKRIADTEISQSISPFKRNKSPSSNASPKFEIKSTKKYEDWINFNQEKEAEREM